MLPLSLFGVPWYLLAGIAFGFGAIIGSFLNVVIYRLHTGRSLKGRSHCLSCGAGLRWYELVPVVSYLALRGRCGHCGARFTLRYLGVELLTALLFVLTLLSFYDLVEVLMLWVVMAVLVVIFVYDLRHLIIPDELVVVLLTLALVRLGYVFANGAVSAVMVGYTAMIALGAALFFGGLWYYSGGRWIGLGDVKLVGPLGLLVGGGGVFSMVVLSFWVGAVVSILLLVLARWSNGGKSALPFGIATLTMKSAVPFAPFLIVGCLLVLFWQLDVLTLFAYELSL